MRRETCGDIETARPAGLGSRVSGRRARLRLARGGRRARHGNGLPGEKRKPAAPYSPAGESRSTLGEEALDFRVRNGNGYDSLSMATGKRNAESTV